MELMVGVGWREVRSDDDGERSRGGGRARVAGRYSIFGHTNASLSYTW